MPDFLTAQITEQTLVPDRTGHRRSTQTGADSREERRAHQRRTAVGIVEVQRMELANTKSGVGTDAGEQ